MLAATNTDCLWVKDFIPFHRWSFVTPEPAFTFPSVCTVPVHTHPAVESCFAEAHNSQRSGCPPDYLERSVPPSPVAHRFSLRWQRTERGQPRSHANLLRHLQHLHGEKGNLVWNQVLCKYVPFYMIRHLEENTNTDDSIIMWIHLLMQQDATNCEHVNNRAGVG